MAEREPTSHVAKLTLPIGRGYNFWYDYNENDTVFIFVHGILSDSLECWTYEDKQDPEKSCYWPDLIREDGRFGSPSIYMGGYFTKPSAGDLGISESAQILFNALRQTDLRGRPGPLARRKLVFVCHSTGGIVTRYLIRQHGDDLAGKVVGLVLIASPSLGSIEANKLQSLAKFYNNQLGLQLRIGDPVLDDLDKAFRELVYNLQNASDASKKFLLYGKEAYETYYILRRWLLPRRLHSLVPNRRKLVPSRSANVYFGLADPLPDTDHFDTVKPSSLNHPSHEMLALFWEDFKKYLDDHQSFFSARDVVLLRKVEVHVGRQTPGQPDTQERSRANVLVGIALDTSGSMHESIRNDTGGILSRLEGAQRAIRRLGQSVQSELQKRIGSSDANEEIFRVFVYGFGLRHRDVGDLLALFRAAQTMDIQKEVERKRLAYTRQAEQSAAGYGGMASLARQYGLGGVVDSLAAGARAEAERSIRERITNEIADLLFSSAEAIGDATLSANELSALWNDESNLTVESIEPLIYGNTPMRRAAEAIAARFHRTASVSDTEKRILIVISDGEPTDGDPRTIFASMQQAGVTIVSCFVTDENIAEPRTLVALPQSSWGAGARLMFEIASPLDEREELARLLLSQGWTIEPGAKLFVQVNHSEVLGEFVRAAGADIVASGGASLPEGR